MIGSDNSAFDDLKKIDTVLLNQMRKDEEVRGICARGSTQMQASYSFEPFAHNWQLPLVIICIYTHTNIKL